MRSRLLTCGFLLLLAAPLGAEQPIALTIRPEVARAPADVEIHATVERTPENRTLTFVAESRDFYRSSEVQLNDESPLTWVVRYRALPPGTYEVTVTVGSADGGTRSTTGVVRVV